MGQNGPKPTAEYPLLFRPFHIGACRLKNRLVALPVYTGYACPDGRVSPLMLAHYRRLAGSGAALVVVANTAVAPEGIVSANNLRIDRDDAVAGLARLAEAIHAGGALACLQLNHAGRFARTAQPLLPSAIASANLAFNVASLKNFMNFFPLETRFALTRDFLAQVNTWRRSMTAADIETAVDAFGQAAVRARRAGFDMVELHGAGGYLICQFLSAFTNRIPSGFGGDLCGRAAFAVAVVRGIRHRLPPDFPVGFRIILQEWVPGGIALPEALAFARMMEAEGIAYLSASVGSYHSLFSQTALRRTSRPAYLKADMQRLTAAVGVPTVVSGRIVTPALAETLLRQRVASLIGLGRPLRADPDWIRKAASGQRKITACINCHGCLKRVVLNQGFNCTQWSREEQERTDLSIRLLGRSHRNLWVAADRQDLERLQAALPRLLPDRRRPGTGFAATVCFLQTARSAELPENLRADFLRWCRGLLDRSGMAGTDLQAVVRTAGKSPDREVLAEIHSGGYGVVFVGRNRGQGWRERLLYLESGRVTALIDAAENPANILVPVDLSPATLPLLRFVHRAYLGCEALVVDFVHVLGGGAGTARNRWEAIKRVVGTDAELPLKLAAGREGVAAELLRAVSDGGYGTVIMGKRGLSGIKRWMLGSVSAAVLRGLTHQNLILVD